MKTFVIINGDKMYMRLFMKAEHAEQWAINYMDHSKEVIVREVDEVDINTTFKSKNTTIKN